MADAAEARWWVAALALGVVWWAAAAAVGCGAQPVVVASYGQPRLWLKPYDWSYLRVELPASFSSVTMDFVTDRDIQREHLKDLPRGELAIICLMNSNPPIPDISDSFLDISNFLAVGSFGSANNQSNLAQCIPFQKNTTIVLTNDQISPGIWYIGYFNGLGPARTQSKMISRGRGRSVSTSITVEGCSTSTLWGPYCNQTIEMISCSQPSRYNNSRNLLDLSIDKRNNLNTREHKRRINFLSQWNHLEEKGVGSNSTTYVRMDNLITCAISNGSLCLRQGDMKFYFLDVVNLALQFEITAKNFGLAQMPSLICYLRYNAFPRRDLHDYSGDISSAPLVLKLPNIGRWYIAIETVNITQMNSTVPTPLLDTTCFSLEWQVTECLNGKAGTNCSWEAYMLQRVPKRSPSAPFESYYVPSDGRASLEHSQFSLEQFLSNLSFEPYAWTYFFLDIPYGSAGALIHVQIKSDKELNYELYSKYGGLPSNESWDYYASRTSSSNGSVYFSLQNSTNSDMDLSIFYAKEGTWCFGVKHPGDKGNSQTYMSISLQGCHKNCNQKGSCHASVDESGLTFYSFCTCDRDHGGFDCNEELVSPKGHIWQSVLLIASNGAAILPAFWALRQKFLDFWLSFMAVIGTFIYMATIDEASKRAMHTAVFILTALLAATGATRWPNFRSLFWSTLELLNKRFRWIYLLLGFVTLAFAATSWKLESNRSYWIWHSLWHITIYTSSFFFLCSLRINTVNLSPEPSYEFTSTNN
uniref:EGF-like domain-containing protein n=1 Tax=Leersia perrieri TaxID=77586 RepID=A0A0D9XK53_9ORYZ